MIGYRVPFPPSGVYVCVLPPFCIFGVAVVGLVDELVVDNDPEYQWMDNFRQARTSNESRQSLLFKLDATVRRQLGKKVGRNAHPKIVPRCCAAGAAVYAAAAGATSLPRSLMMLSCCSYACRLCRSLF